MRILMLDGDSNISLFVARCLAQIPNAQLFVIAESKCSPLRFSRHKVEYITNSEFYISPDISERLQFLSEIIREKQIDIVIPVEDSAVEFISHYRRQLERITNVMLTPSSDTLKIVTNKWQLAQVFEKYHLPTPKTILFTENDHAVEEFSNTSLPVLCKPAEGRGGEGIRFFDEIESCLAHLQKMELDGNFPPFIIQSFVPGYDIDCSVICQDGKILAHTIQKGVIPRNGRFAPPAGIEFVNNKKVLNLVTELMQILHFSGVAHIDLRIEASTGQVKFIEINSRYWASIIGSLKVGVNFPHLACLASLGHSFEYPAYELDRYVDFSAAIREGMKRLLRKDCHHFHWKEVGLRHVLTDPLAEIVRLV